MVRKMVHMFPENGQYVTGKWSISPGNTPIHQTLAEADERRGYDIEPRSESERSGIIGVGSDDLQDDQSL